MKSCLINKVAIGKFVRIYYQFPPPWQELNENGNFQEEEEGEEKREEEEEEKKEGEKEELKSTLIG